MSSNAPAPTADLRRLVEFAQQGDREALETLYLLHFDRIYSYLHMSVGNRHDAEDLTTQTFLKMLEAIGRFRWRSAPFSAWLFRIAHNLAMDHFRAARRTQPEEEVLTLKFVFNFPNAEVATILGKTEGAIKSLQHRALVSLQKQLTRSAS